MALGLPSTFSQDLNIKCLATSFKYSPDEGETWTDWYEVNIKVIITDELITIYSNETQRYKLQGFTRIPQGQFVNYATRAMDSEGKQLNIVLSINKEESIHFLSFFYKDVNYVYELRDY